MRRSRWEMIKIRLDDWGSWKAKPIPGMSYPSMSVEARMMDGGSGSTVKNWPRYEPSPYHSQTDIAISEIHDLVWISILQHKHVDKRKDIEIAKLLDCSTAKVNNELASIYAYLSGKLGYRIKK